MNALTLTALPGLPLVKEGDELPDLILQGLQRGEIRLQDNDVIIVSQKIVSKAEGRRVSLAEVVPSRRAVELAAAVDKDPRVVELVLQESVEILRTRPGLIVVEHRCGFVCANAGIDQSNVEGEEVALLLPADPEASAQSIRRALSAAAGVDVGVLVVDSHGRAWRLGAVGVAIGVAGFPALVDLRGTPDLHDRPLQITEIGLADEVCAAASILMGQAAEGQPVVHVRGLPYELREGSLRELLRPVEEDLFR